MCSSCCTNHVHCVIFIVQEELSSSVEQPTTNRQHSSASREGQTAEETEEPFLSNVQPASSDSNSATLAMEDSGFGTGGSASWKSVKTTDSEVAAGSESESKGHVEKDYVTLLRVYMFPALV